MPCWELHVYSFGKPSPPLRCLCEYIKYQLVSYYTLLSFPFRSLGLSSVWWALIIRLVLITFLTEGILFFSMTKCHFAINWLAELQESNEVILTVQSMANITAAGRRSATLAFCVGSSCLGLNLMCTSPGLRSFLMHRSTLSSLCMP